jgi:murein DD-endopeptidase MepM/ murein hydrolase activator NlpD
VKTDDKNSTGTLAADSLAQENLASTEINEAELQEGQQNIANAPPSEFINPVAGKLISPFNKTSQGINIAATLGDPVKSIHGGRVVFAEHSNQYGNLVMVKAENSDLFVAYGHLDELMVRKGEVIGQNHVIGYVGQTGKVDFPQLYLAIRKGKIALDPLEYLDY